MTRSRPKRTMPRYSPSKSPTLPTSWLVGFGFIVVLYLVLPRTWLGLPPSLMFSALADQQVRESLFSGDTEKLRYRLKAIGLEDQANTHFEEAIPDERDRERYLDQQFRDATGDHNSSEYKEEKDGTLTIKE